jgi:hypothetical protein
VEVSSAGHAGSSSCTAAGDGELMDRWNGRGSDSRGNAWLIGLRLAGRGGTELQGVQGLADGTLADARSLGTSALNASHLAYVGEQAVRPDG